jgi:hypothetical protein
MSTTLSRFGRAAAAAHAPFLHGAIEGLRHAWQGLREGRARRRRLARMHAAIAALDDATLRDIGVQRSEVGSFWAEYEGLAPVTRQRLFWLGHARA